jgi:hypothetical protein
MTVVLKQPARSVNRLASVRRLYVYLVAFVSLAAGLAGLSNLVETLARLWLGSVGDGLIGGAGFGRSVASSAGLLLVATPIFLVHWGLAQSHQREAEERDALLRKLFLYAASAIALGGLLINAYLLIEGIAQLAFGLPPAQSSLLPSQWLAWSLLALANGAFLAYWYHVLQTDGDYAQEATPGRIIRQLFMLVAGLVGLLVLLWGTASALQTLLRLFVDQMTATAGWGWWPRTLGSAVAQISIGSWLAFSNRAQWHSVVAMQASEGQAALRRFYLYAAVVIGAVATLTPAALVLRELLLMLFGDAGGELTALLNKLITPISFVPIGLAIWLWHWRVLSDEANAYGESHQGATVRRIYYYLMAAIGLALTWVGAVQLLHAVIDTLLTTTGSTFGVWHEPLANGLSLLTIGAPIWALHWRTMQHRARLADEAGDDERGALPRKIYLYGVALVGALIILFQLAQVVYRLLLMSMGDPSAAVFSTETAHKLADCVVAAVFWTVHVLAIRGDSQMDKERPAPAAASEELSLEQRRASLQTQIVLLEEQLAAAHTALAELEHLPAPSTER